MRTAYVELSDAGRLAERAQVAVERLRECRMCPRQCGVNRLEGELGVCRTGRHAQVASQQLHFGEEKPLVGGYGSGTIFFAHCNLRCAFCQNWDISRPEVNAPEYSPEELAEVMLGLQAQGAMNINLVSPSHVGVQVLEALPLAVDRGLAIPLVWNSGGYDSVETLKLMDGVVDIYMPDVKFWDAATAQRVCGVEDYPERAREALAEMHRQVGDLHMDGRTIARRGLLVRHLVLPEGMAGTAEWMKFLAGLSPETYINVMEQYHPCADACTMDGLDRPVRPDECADAKRMAKDAGLHRLDDAGEAMARVMARLLGQVC